MSDYYQILGISKNASQDEIKRAYRRLAQQHHPDKGGDAKKFKEINEAYQVLGNPQKRAQYDRFGTTFEQARQAGGFAGFDGFRDFASYAEAFDFFKDRSRGFGGAERTFDLGDIFGEIFGFGGEEVSQRAKNKGEDLAVELEISLEEAFSGSRKTIDLYKGVACPVCKGSGAAPGSETKSCLTCQGKGQVQRTQRMGFFSFSQVQLCPDCQGQGERAVRRCSECGGDGRIRASKSIELKIPPGIKDGQLISIKGQGEAGRFGAPSGNLYVRVQLKPHRAFKRFGDDLHYKKVINFTQAALGDKVEIPTLGKKIKLKIPARIQSGTKIRIAGKGMPRFQQRGRGDLIIEVEVKTPKKLSRRAKELLEKLKEELE